jgi:hypothetical protein
VLFSQQKAKPAECSSCHKDFASALPKDHATVPMGGLSQCLTCHKRGLSAASDRFAVRLHHAHESERQKLECTTCHNHANGLEIPVARK